MVPAGCRVARPLPSVTAVIPARNEADILPACLPTLLSQDYKGRLSIIVVDDDSTDGTGKIAEGLGAELLGGGRCRTAS